MKKVVLYTRVGCHLCEVVEEQLEKLHAGAAEGGAGQHRHR